jgi:hypothetical protein
MLIGVQGTVTGAEELVSSKGAPYYNQAQDFALQLLKTADTTVSIDH